MAQRICPPGSRPLAREEEAVAEGRRFAPAVVSRDPLVAAEAHPSTPDRVPHEGDPFNDLMGWGGG